MKLLVVGSGGREHALVWHFSRSPLVEKIFAAPGNAGIAALASCVPIVPTDVEGLTRFARLERIDLTVVGPEAVLAAGIADVFGREKLALFGPTKKAARLESSKSYAKELMKRHGIPTAPFMIFTNREQAGFYVRRRNGPLVIKADGLAEGKGVFVCANRDEAEQAVDSLMKEERLGAAGRTVIVEEVLSGEEASIMAITDGRTILILPPCQDYKRLRDGHQGPNTGGMGAICPTPVVTPKIMRVVEREILVPIVHALSHQGVSFRGVIYAGLMITEKGPYVLEFNVRLGDPETQPLFHRIRSDLAPLFKAVADGRIPEEMEPPEFDERTALCVIMASGGYPGSYRKGLAITGLDAINHPDITLFHAGTRLEEGRYLTNGGRVLGISALGKDFAEARDRAYRASDRIQFEGRYYRKDIGLL